MYAKKAITPKLFLKLSSAGLSIRLQYDNIRGVSKHLWSGNTADLILKDQLIIFICHKIYLNFLSKNLLLFSLTLERKTGDIQTLYITCSISTFTFYNFLFCIVCFSFNIMQIIHPFISSQYTEIYSIFSVINTCEHYTINAKYSQHIIRD